jgi:hypothetical protein
VIELLPEAQFIFFSSGSLFLTRRSPEMKRDVRVSATITERHPRAMSARYRGRKFPSTGVLDGLSMSHCPVYLMGSACPTATSSFQAERKTTRSSPLRNKLALISVPNALSSARPKTPKKTPANFPRRARTAVGSATIIETRGVRRGVVRRGLG